MVGGIKRAKGSRISDALQSTRVSFPLAGKANGYNKQKFGGDGEGTIQADCGETKKSVGGAG
jgi:hypothetical protein